MKNRVFYNSLYLKNVGLIGVGLLDLALFYKINIIH